MYLDEIEREPQGILDRIQAELCLTAPEISKKTKSILLRILENIAKNPTEEKYKKINKVVVEKHNKLSNVLYLLGFITIEDKLVCCRQKIDIFSKIITNLAGEIR